MRNCLVTILILSIGLPCIMAEEPANNDTTTIPEDLEAQATTYNEMPSGAEAVENAVSIVWRTYKDYDAWSGRDHPTLLALGMVQGTDYFVHPTTALQAGIPDDTDVVLITSNSLGYASTRENVNHPDAQAALADFLSRGGVLIVDMGDNDDGGGYYAPGATGTANDVLANPEGDATLDPTAVANSHPFTVGLNNDNIDMAPGYAYYAHGNLVGVIPDDATVLMTASFLGPGSPQQPILAEYCFQGGRVIVDTITKEFYGHNPAGTGPSLIMTNLFAYAMSQAAHCLITVEVDVKPGSFPSSVNLKSKGVTPVAVHTTDDFEAIDIVPESVKLGDCDPSLVPVKAVLYDCDEIPNPLYGDPEYPDAPEMIGDGDLDWVFYFETCDLECLGDVTEVILTGITVYGIPFEGTSDIRFVKQGKP